MQNLHLHLREILQENQIRISLLDRHAYASDAGCYTLLPQAVVVPESEQDIRQLFGFCRQHQVPLVFRAGGTSLAGQSITDGILADLSISWKKVEALNNGTEVLVQPGVTGDIVNRALAVYRTKLGPDPASIIAAQMGGIISNNASGMCCGVALNSYHTLRHLRFILPNGNVFDSRIEQDYERFEKEETLLFETLLETRKSIMNNGALREKISRKYRTKNTVGYSLNALVDFEHPLDIFIHLLVGGEGTLAFISEAVMQTVPDKPLKTTSLLFFTDIHSACASIPELKNNGAEAVELMDRASLRSVEELPGMPDFMKLLPGEAAALLVEYQAIYEEELSALVASAEELIARLPLVHPAGFTRNHAERQAIWKVRKGLFPSVGSMRKRGTTVILEDIAFPVEKLADAVIDLQQLFVDFGYEDAIIFGHAKDGNLHFCITQVMDEEKEIRRYDAFLKAMVSLVIDKYDGALKAEHGTGRNMAPFVEKEWGPEAYAIMQRLKEVVDPENILNPGVIINADAEAHLKNIKPLPVVEEEVDKCIECGFCEPACPSRLVTMTPRRRIAGRRAMAIAKNEDPKAWKKLVEEYEYDGLDTCAVDGLCATECPVGINTGELVKRLRKENHSRIANRIAKSMAKNFGSVESQLRGLLGLGAGINHFAGTNWLTRITRILHGPVKGIPVFESYVTRAREFPYQNPPNPEIVYFPSCINRIFEQYPRPAKPLQNILLQLSNKAGIEVLLPPDVKGHCCGQPFSSKGFSEASQIVLKNAIHALWIWTRQGRIPVVCDFSSCTYTFLQNGKNLPEEDRHHFEKIRFIDSVEYLSAWIVPKLDLKKTQQEAVLHPACSVIKMGKVGEFRHIAESCTENVELPVYAGCCGMAGDRGFLFPELTEGATRLEIQPYKGNNHIKGYSSAATCEMNLTHASGFRYDHIAYLVWESCQ